MTHAPGAPTVPAVAYVHAPHPHLGNRRTPAKVRDHAGPGINGRLALIITGGVGTMWAAYLFAIIGTMGIVGALSNNVELVLLVGAVSGYFLQLVLLPIIIVGQNIQGKAADGRANSTYQDAEAILHECLQLQAHLQAQDEVLDDLVKRLQAGPSPA